MPRPVDLDRLLHHEIKPGAVARFAGEVCHASMARVAEFAPALARPASNAQLSIEPAIAVAPPLRAS